MTTSTSWNLLRRPLAAAIVAAALIGVPALASAQGTSSFDIAEKAPWKACLDGAQPTTKNVPAVDFDGRAPFGVDIMDTNPHWDEVILDFHDSLSEQEIVAYTKQLGLDVRVNSEYANQTNVYIARVEEGAVPYVKDCLTAQAPKGWIEAIEENFEYRVFETESAPSTTPDDPLYQFQWNFKQVNAEKAWKVSTGRDVVVAVIDTGVTYKDDASRGIKAGKDLKGTRFVAGYDFVDKSDFVYDGHGHGTHVAGTIAQATNNGYGVAGLAYDAKIMPIRVLNSRGFGQVADIADAVRWSADNGAQVINMSLGGPLPSLVLKRAIDYAHKKGVTVVAAAGNAGKRSPSYPAAYDHVIAVAATQFDQRTTFYSQWGGYVDIAAPGGNTRVDQNGDGRPDGILQETLKAGKLDEHDFSLYMGTSMASPHVAAIAALVISQGITHPDKVAKVLQKTANDSMKTEYKDAKEYQERYGAGLVQADKAVAHAATMQGTWRFSGAFLLALLAFAGVRRKDVLAMAPKHAPLLFGSAMLAAGGLFFLPFILPGGGTMGYVASLLARPVAQWDVIFAGLGAHQNPLLASFLIPLGAYALFGGRNMLRIAACGLALGMAAFCFTEAYLLTSDVRWIPGMNILDRVWLVSNGLLSLAIGYFGLKRS
ncbi:MAG: peptidase S8 [Bradymonadaceae bacterium]|nr:peptidase S8 [Lujinxingiaceae bacterium]